MSSICSSPPVSVFVWPPILLPSLTTPATPTSFLQAVMALLAGATFLPRLAGKPSLTLFSPPAARQTHVVHARRGISSRTKKALSTAAPPTPGKEEAYNDSNFDETGSGLDATGDVDDGYVLPELPGEEPDFWEGAQWDALGFFVQYLWAFGIVFAVCMYV